MEIELHIPEGARSGGTLQIDTGSAEIDIPAGLGEGHAFTVVGEDGSSEEDHAQRHSAAGSVQDARAAAWGLNDILKQAKQYAEQQRRMQEHLACALPQGIQSLGNATAPTDALLAWLRTFPSVTSSCTDWTQLCDGLAILQAFSEIDSTARDEPEPEPEVAPLQTTPSTRSLQQFLAQVDRFIVTQLQGTVNLSHIDIDSIAHRAVSAEIALIELLGLLLGCAILCNDNALFIKRILNDLEIETQASLADIVQAAMTTFDFAPSPSVFVEATDETGEEINPANMNGNEEDNDEDEIKEAESSELGVAADSEESHTKKLPATKHTKKCKKKKKIRRQKPDATALSTTTARASKASGSAPVARNSSTFAPTRMSAGLSPVGEHTSGQRAASLSAATVARVDDRTVTSTVHHGRDSTNRAPAAGGLAAEAPVHFRSVVSSTVDDAPVVVPKARERHEKLAEASRQRKQAKESKQRRDAARAAKQAKSQRAKQAKTAKRVTARLTDTQDYTFIHKQRLDAAASGVKIQDRAFDVMSPDEIARRDAKMAKVSSQRNNEEFLSRIDRYTTQRQERVQAAQAKLREMEKHRHGLVVDPVHNPTVVHKAKKLTETDLIAMGERMNSWAQKHESSLQFKRDQEEEKMLAQVTGTPEINGKPMPRSAATKAETIERLHAERQVHDARRAEKREEAVAKATARWANASMFKDNFVIASAQRTAEGERKPPAPRPTIFSPVKVERKPFGVSLQQLRQLKDEQDRTNATKLTVSQTGTARQDGSKSITARAAAATEKTGSRTKKKADQHDGNQEEIEEAEPSELPTAQLEPEPELELAAHLALASPSATNSTNSDADAPDDSAERLQQVQKLVANVPLLQQLSEFQIEELTKDLTRKQFAAGEAIVTQGEEGDEMYFLEAGDAVADVDGQGVAKQYTCGAFFGEIALTDWLGVRAATVRAGANGATCFVLGRDTFERHVVSNKGAEAVLAEREEEYERLDCVVPEGLGAGDVVMVTAPDGREMEVTVPDGAHAGDTFEFDARLPSNVSPDRETEHGTTDAIDHSSTRSDDEMDDVCADEGDEQAQTELVIDVVVPEGCGPGDLLEIETPAGMIEVVVPEGHSAGECFEVSTPR